MSDEEMSKKEEKEEKEEKVYTPSRRQVLTSSMALAAGAVGSTVGSGVLAQPSGQGQQAPSIATGSQAGRRFRGLISWRGTQGFREAAVENLTLRALDLRNVLIRVEASAPCYTIVRAVLDTAALGGEGGGPPGAPPTPSALTANHSYVGVVEAISPDVKRVRVGDRVIVGVTAQCGVCYQCLQGNADMCLITFGGDVSRTRAFADLDDGTPVLSAAGVGGISELAVAFEEQCVAVYTDLPSVDLSLLGCHMGTGFATSFSRMNIFPGANVVVFGAGPIGLSAAMMAKAGYAGQVIVVEPISYRRDIAMQIGATTVIDPTVEPDTLVQRIQQMCTPRTDNLFGGGGRINGADFAIGAVGAQAYPPPAPIEAQPDPTGITPFQQNFAVARGGGNVIWVGIPSGNASFGAGALGNSGKTLWPGQNGGIQFMRDMPRLVSMMEQGVLNYRPALGNTYNLDQALDAVRAIGDRREIASVVVMNN